MDRLRTIFRILAAAIVICLSASASKAFAASIPPASNSDPQKELLGKLVGHWTMSGNIGKSQTVHDVDAAWVLNEEYVEIHEVSHDKDAAGKPKYEALILVVWDPKVKQFACMWLDTTGYGVFTQDGVGKGVPDGDKMSFLFGTQGDGIHTTFAYDRSKDAWTWDIHNLISGKVSPFARLRLVRRQS